MEKAIREEDHIETSIRPVTAYSTLGYFNDPILPGLLRSHPVRLLEVLFHELAHGTLWLEGSVRFNESFASFVGEQLTREFLLKTRTFSLLERYEIRLKDGGFC